MSRLISFSVNVCMNLLMLLGVLFLAYSPLGPKEKLTALWDHHAFCVCVPSLFIAVTDFYEMYERYDIGG
jgi:hypothetical protein